MLAMWLGFDDQGDRLSLGRKMWEINWGFVLLVILLASVGFAVLYSAAGGDLDPWASRQITRFGIGVLLMLTVAVIDIRVSLRFAYVFYAVSLVLLVAVELVGKVGMGAQRWLHLGVIQIQPSELMKISLILALARYFHGLSIEDVGRLRWLIVPVVMCVAPAALVMKQPDLGTALMLLSIGGALLFLVGVRIWKFAGVIAIGLVMMPIAYAKLHDYQRRRIEIFLDPEQDPLGAGYHILQSKIAMGSGGMFGKGYLQGTQSHLSFLPEHHTDFIFTTLAEEFGMAGGLVLISLYVLLLIYGYAIAFRSRSQYGRLVGLGVTVMLFVYFYVNIAMVSGLLPVVGIPLPLLSYGGTAMMTLMMGFGLLLSVYVHRDIEIPRRIGGI